MGISRPLTEVLCFYCGPSFASHHIQRINCCLCWEWGLLGSASLVTFTLAPPPPPAPRQVILSLSGILRVDQGGSGLPHLCSGVASSLLSVIPAGPSPSSFIHPVAYALKRESALCSRWWVSTSYYVCSVSSVTQKSCDQVSDQGQIFGKSMGVAASTY